MIWSADEKLQLRAVSLQIIRSIAEKYGGTVEADFAANTVNITVPTEQEPACSREIDEHIGNLCL